MPRRPRSHQLEDQSRNRLHAAFNSVSWTVEDLRKDYGEDLLVRIFDNQVATPLVFFVQARATDNIQKYSSSTGLVRFPIESRHFQHWKQFWEPVIVSLWDSKADRTYWNCVQTYLSSEEGKNVLADAGDTLRIPLDKILDRDGLLRIHAITKSRFERAEHEQEGAQALIELLREHLKLEIEYDPRGGVLVVAPPGELPIFGFFGRAREQVEDLAKHWGCSFEEAFDLVLRTLHDLMANDPAAQKAFYKSAFLFDQIGKLEEGDAWLDLIRRRRKPKTKPGPPDINQLRNFLVPSSKRRQSPKNLPRLFSDSNPPGEES
jgi:hypothetical protein